MAKNMQWRPRPKSRMFPSQPSASVKLLVYRLRNKEMRIDSAHTKRACPFRPLLPIFSYENYDWVCKELSSKRVSLRHNAKLQGSLYSRPGKTSGATFHILYSLYDSNATIGTEHAQSNKLQIAKFCTT